MSRISLASKPSPGNANLYNIDPTEHAFSDDDDAALREAVPSTEGHETRTIDHIAERYTCGSRRAMILKGHATSRRCRRSSGKLINVITGEVSVLAIVWAFVL